MLVPKAGYEKLGIIAAMPIQLTTVSGLSTKSDQLQVNGLRPAGVLHGCSRAGHPGILPVRR